MRDNLRRYRAIHKALTQWYPIIPHGNLARHLTTLAALISGIVGSKSAQLPHIAGKVPDGAKPESRVKRFARWVDTTTVTETVSLLPYAEVLLWHLAIEKLVLVLDGSAIGRGCVALMVSVVYTGRALPLCWLVRRGTKGHVPEAMHLAVLGQVKGLVPAGAEVVVLGDGEFDGIRFLHTVHEAGWSYVCRTGCAVTGAWDGMIFPLATVRECIKPGTIVELSEAWVTGARYGPVLVVCCWDPAETTPLYLISKLASAAEASQLYRKRFRIATFFSDQKSRGFHLHTSHIADPKRLSRLLLASCLASLWMIYLGSLCLQEGWQGIIHRTDRCDVSLFQLGLRLLDHLLNENMSIPVAFVVRL
jgi:hypothetical protein